MLTAFRSAGCHGDAWFGGVDATEWLPPCSGSCANDLGEVTLGTEGELRMDSPVGDIGFRKPSGTAVLAAVCALTAVAGPVAVFDDSGDAVFVVHPAGRPAELRPRWFW